MGDVGEDYKALKEIKKQQRKERLLHNEKKFSEYPFKKNTDYHWSLNLQDERLDFYPSKGFGIYKNKRISIRAIEELLKQTPEGEES